MTDIKTAADSTTKKSKQDDPRHGSFCLSESEIRLLLANKASAAEIFAFMVIKRFKTSQSMSSAGYSAVRRVLGIGTKKAVELLDKLQRISSGTKLLLSPKPTNSIKYSDIFDSMDEYTYTVSYKHNKDSHNRKRSRWIIDVPDDDCAWFDNGIIDYQNNSKIITRSIKLNNDIAIRLLLLIHYYNNTTYNAVDVSGIMSSFNYNYIYNSENLFLYKINRKSNLHISHKFRQLLFDGHETNLNIDDQNKTIISALNDLEMLGFIKRTVLVLLLESNTIESLIGFYELDIKTSDCQEKRKYREIALKLLLTAREKGYQIGRQDNRFYDEYVAAVPDSATCFLACDAYRPTYAVTNPNNKGVRQGIELRDSTLKSIMDRID